MLKGHRTTGLISLVAPEICFSGIFWISSAANRSSRENIKTTEAHQRPIRSAVVEAPKAVAVGCCRTGGVGSWPDA